MSAATASTSSNRSRSYRLSVKPRPVRAMPASASLHRTRSCAVTGSSTGPTLAGRSREAWGGAGPGDVVLAVVHGVEGVHQRPPDLVEVLDVGDLAAARVTHVEGVDGVALDGLDLGRGDVEVELVQGSRDPPQHAHGVGGPHLQHGVG